MPNINFNEILRIPKDSPFAESLSALCVNKQHDFSINLYSQKEFIEGLKNAFEASRKIGNPQDGSVAFWSFEEYLHSFEFHNINKNVTTHR